MTNTQLIVEHHKDMTIREMSDKFNIRKEAVCATLSQKGLKAKPGRVVINEATTWQVKKLAPTHTIVEIMDLIGLSKAQTVKILRINNIETRGYIVKPNPIIKALDKEYFDINDWKEDKIFI